MFAASVTETQVQDCQLRAIVARARAMGEDHGRSAASWYFDGNTTDETYRIVLAGIDDGDPAVLDTFPASPLSGEWADDPTPASVLEDLDIDEDSFAADAALQAYEDGFYTASSDAIERVARYMLAPEGPDPFDGIPA